MPLDSKKLEPGVGLSTPGFQKARTRRGYGETHGAVGLALNPVGALGLP
jgi:hypothetical protein